MKPKVIIDCDPGHDARGVPHAHQVPRHRRRRRGPQATRTARVRRGRHDARGQQPQRERFLDDRRGRRIFRRGPRVAGRARAARAARRPPQAVPALAVGGARRLRRDARRQAGGVRRQHRARRDRVDDAGLALMRRLMASFCPGPLTLVAPACPELPPGRQMVTFVVPPGAEAGATIQIPVGGPPVVSAAKDTA